MTEEEPQEETREEYLARINSTSAQPTKPASGRAGMTTGAKIVLVVLVLIMVGVIVKATGGGSDDSSSSGSGSQDSTIHVRYELDGTASSASVTLSTPTGTSQQDTDVPMMNKSGTTGLRFTGFLPDDFLYISAQNDGSGTLTCRIIVDGVAVSENTASGEYAIATCEGRA